MKYLLSFRLKRKGGAVVPGRLVREPGLGTLDTLRLESRVSLLIHGFNVNYEEGRRDLLAFADMLPSAANDAMVAVLWPGDHWSGPLSYSFEGRDADDTAFELGRFLNDTLRPDASVSIVAHSLGCRVTMETIKRLNALGRTVSQVCLMAPAIDDDCLSGPGEYLREASSVDRIAAMSSLRDKVLKFAYPAGDVLQAFIFRRESADMALGYHGPRRHRDSGNGVPVNILDLCIARNLNVDHGDYLPGEEPSERQRAAAAFADAVIAGAPDPGYR